MSQNDGGEKTEEATPKKLDEAKERGQFVQVPEINTAFIILAAIAVVYIWAGTAARRIIDLAGLIFAGLSDFRIDDVQAADWLSNGPIRVFFLLAPVLGGCALAGILAGGLQTGFRLSPKALEPKWSKVNPLQGLKRIYSMNTIVMFGIDLLKFSGFGVIVAWTIHGSLGDPIFFTESSFIGIGTFIRDKALLMLIRIFVALLLVTAIHYMWSRYKFHKDMRMSTQEIKDEHKDMEGDPNVKSQRKRLALQTRQRKMLDAVPMADVVVTNPTHFAIALRYDPEKDFAPVILAKGKNLFAKRIKSVAAKHKVPMYEDRPTARLLYDLGEVGSPIPQRLFQAVALILSHVYRQHKYHYHQLKARRRLAATK